MSAIERWNISQDDLLHLCSGGLVTVLELVPVLELVLESVLGMSLG